MDTGVITISRQLLSREWFNDSKTVHLYLYFLLQANTQDEQWRGIPLRRGQLATTLSALASATGLTTQNVRTAIKRLTQSGDILHASTQRQYVVITVCNYDRFQGGLSETEQKTPRAANTETNTETNTASNTAANTEKTFVSNCVTHRYSGEILKTNTETNTAANTETNTETNTENEGKKQPAAADAFHFDEAKFCEFFNAEMNEQGAIIPQIRFISKSRRTHIEARCREYGKKALVEMVRKAARSNFLNGQNNRGWKASFSWLILPENFLKVIEGTFDNTSKQLSCYDTKPQDRYAKRRGVDSAARSAEDYTDTL